MGSDQLIETDIVIIGAGTAGLTAAIYAQRAGKHALVLEQTVYGGQIINTPDIENYPGMEHVSGFDFAQALYKQATDLGAEVIIDTVTSIQEASVANAQAAGSAKIITTGSGKRYKAGAVILATGAKNRHLGLPREEELIGKGISYCATCDGMFFKGKDVAVNGGGNTALGDALYLSGICHKVYVIHRRDAFRGVKSDLDKLKGKDNVQFLLDSTVTALNGKSKLESIDVTNKKSGEVRKLDVSALFVAIGQVPDNQAFAPLVALDERGYIKAGEDCRTNCEGIFAAGDCRTKTLRQLTTAASDGAIAATAACEYIDRQ